MVIYTIGHERKQEERRLIFYPEIMEKEKKKFIKEFSEEYNEMLKGKCICEQHY